MQTPTRRRQRAFGAFLAKGRIEGRREAKEMNRNAAHSGAFILKYYFANTLICVTI